MVCNSFNGLQLFCSKEDGGEEEVALLNFVIMKIKDEGLTSKLNQMHPK